MSIQNQNGRGLVNKIIGDLKESGEKLKMLMMKSHVTVNVRGTSRKTFYRR